MTVQKPIILSETIYISRPVARSLHTLAAISAAASGNDVPNVNAMADEILSKYLATIPDLVAREEAVKAALKEIDKKFKTAEAAPT